MKTLFTSYYAKSGKHPLAVSISVVKPRWFPGMLHCPELAPTWKLVEAYKIGFVSIKEYTDAYLDILNNRPATADRIVAALAEGSVLLCYERPPQFCHRHLAAQWLMDRADVIIKELKYIMLEFAIGNTKVNYPVIFPEAMVHAEVARSMQHMVQRVMKPKGNVSVVSAGSVTIDAWGCHGHSESLGNIKSRRDMDTKIITLFDYHHGIVK